MKNVLFQVFAFLVGAILIGSAVMLYLEKLMKDSGK